MPRAQSKDASLSHVTQANKVGQVHPKWDKSGTFDYFLNLVACWCLITPVVNHIKGNITLVLMHSGVVNWNQLMCDAHTVPEQNRGTTALFLYY